MNCLSVTPLAGYVLAGGASRRMGRDKALLEKDGELLLVRIARALGEVCETVRVLAPAGRYEALGYEVLPDLRPGQGPLGGIETALSNCASEWALIVACDVPNVDGEWLRTLAGAVEDRYAVIASGDPPNPLVAVWRRSALGAVSRAIDKGKLRVRDLLEELPVRLLIPPRAEILANWNEPKDVSAGGD